MEGRVFLLIFSSSFPLCSSKFCERFPPSSLWVPKGGSIMGYFAGVRDVFWGPCFMGVRGVFCWFFFMYSFFRCSLQKLARGYPLSGGGCLGGFVFEGWLKSLGWCFYWVCGAWRSGDFLISFYIVLVNILWGFPLIQAMSDQGALFWGVGGLWSLVWCSMCVQSTCWSGGCYIVSFLWILFLLGSS